MPLPVIFQLGDYVQIRGQSAVGEVQSCSTDYAYVMFPLGILRIKVDQLDRVEKDSYSPKVRAKVSREFCYVKPEIDLHGMSIEEALQATESWLDKVIVRGYTQVKIIHGKGTGALRNAIYQLLQEHPQVKKIDRNHPYLGGSGVTWVSLS